MRILFLFICLLPGCSTSADLTVKAQAVGMAVSDEGATVVPVVITVSNDGFAGAHDFAVAVFTDAGSQLALAVPGQDTAWYPTVERLSARSRTVLTGEVHVATSAVTPPRRLLVHVDRCRPGQQRPCSVAESDEDNNVARLVL